MAARFQGVRPHGGEVVVLPVEPNPNPTGRCPACLRRALSWFPGRKEAFNRSVVIMRWRRMFEVTAER